MILSAFSRRIFPTQGICFAKRSDVFVLLRSINVLTSVEVSTLIDRSKTIMWLYKGKEMGGFAIFLGVEGYFPPLFYWEDLVGCEEGGDGWNTSCLVGKNDV